MTHRDTHRGERGSLTAFFVLFVVALLLTSQGVIQNLDGHTEVAAAYGRSLVLLFLGGFLLGSVGVFLSVYIKQLENFAGTMNFVIFPMFFFSSAPHPPCPLPGGGSDGPLWPPTVNPTTCMPAARPARTPLPLSSTTAQPPAPTRHRRPAPAPAQPAQLTAGDCGPAPFSLSHRKRPPAPANSLSLSGYARAKRRSVAVRSTPSGSCRVQFAPTPPARRELEPTESTAPTP